MANTAIGASAIAMRLKFVMSSSPPVSLGLSWVHFAMPSTLCQDLQITLHGQVAARVFRCEGGKDLRPPFNLRAAVSCVPAAFPDGIHSAEARNSNWLGTLEAESLNDCKTTSHNLWATKVC